MTRLNKVSLLLASCLLSFSALAADSKPPVPKVEYSADQSMETAETTMSGKVYVTPVKERREMNISGETMTMIMRRDKKIAWTLMPSEQMYMEMAFDQAKSQTENLDNFKIETTPMGTETINGVNCDKSKVIMTNLKDGSKMGGFWWVSKDGIVMKMDMIAKEKNEKMRMKLELSNVKVGKQNASLFEIPAGYSKMTMPNMQNIQDMLKDSNVDEAPAQGSEKSNKGGFNFNDALKMIR
jgi:Domain of unknown function (DUF4412)